VIAYHGFALESFRSAREAKRVLNYPTAHHRQQRKILNEELLLEPDFAKTWLPFDEGWPSEYEAELDEEIELADAILVGSSYARDSFVAEGVPPSKLWVVPYGVDLNTFSRRRAHRSDDEFRIVFAGQLIQRKGVSYLLRAYEKFRQADTRLTLIGSYVAGDEPFRPYQGDFQHIPHLTRPALAEAYNNSDVFVFPTLLEGMGLVVLEAMACGLPVIVTANGPGDIVRDGIDGYVVDARDIDAIVDRLRRLYADPEARRKMGENARQRAMEFGWDAYARKVLGFLRNAGVVP
jgi:glycosyltransferase involved in cell wall biosynthesis